MGEAVDYFSNHALKLRFPWSLYHRPIVRALQVEVRDAAGPAVLNVGSGPFLELRDLHVPDRRYTVCDIDARAVAFAREVHGGRLERADVLEPDRPLPYEDASFDLAVSMDVIEHVLDPVGWLSEVVRVVRPGGRIFLTTPNYASRSLVAIENTALEAIARVQGFSRKHLHPTKMTSSRLRDVLAAVGLGAIEVTPIAGGWVLAAHATKR